MTVRLSWFTMDNKIGVDLNRIVASIAVTASPDIPAAPMKLGDRVQGNGGSEWMFVQASATVSAFNTVAIDANARARNVTQALITSNVYTYGVASFRPNQFGSLVSVGNENGGVVNPNDFFWALLRANQGSQLNMVSSVDAGARLFVSAVPGVLTASASNSYFIGLSAVVSAAVTVQGTVEVIMQGPMVAVSVTA